MWHRELQSKVEAWTLRKQDQVGHTLIIGSYDTRKYIYSFRSFSRKKKRFVWWWGIGVRIFHSADTSLFLRPKFISVCSVIAGENSFPGSWKTKIMLFFHWLDLSILFSFYFSRKYGKRRHCSKCKCTNFLTREYKNWKAFYRKKNHIFLMSETRGVWHAVQGGLCKCYCRCCLHMLSCML